MRMKPIRTLSTAAGIAFLLLGAACSDAPEPGEATLHQAALAGAEKVDNQSDTPEQKRRALASKIDDMKASLGKRKFGDAERQALHQQMRQLHEELVSSSAAPGTPVAFNNVVSGPSADAYTAFGKRVREIKAQGGSESDLMAAKRKEVDHE